MIYPSFNMYRSIGYIENYFNNILIWDNSVLCGVLAMREHNEAWQDKHDYLRNRRLFIISLFDFNKNNC